jgi:hypothetical protein
VEPFLATGTCTVVFQSVHEARGRPGSLQEYLVAKGFRVEATRIENASDPVRFLQCAEPGA